MTQIEHGTLAALTLLGSASSRTWVYPGGGDDPEFAAIYARPIVTGGRVFIATHGGFVTTLDADTGRPLPGWDPPIEIGERVVSTPVFDGRRLFVATERGRVYEIDTTAPVPAARQVYEGTDRVWSGLAIVGSTLFVGYLDDRKVVAIDVDSGNALWTRDLAGAVAADLVAEGGLLYVGALNSTLYALDIARDGEVAWSVDADGWFAGEPLVAGGVVFAGTLRGTVIALDAVSGAERWSFHEDGLKFRARPALADGTLVVAARDGHLVGLDPATGALRWPMTSLENTTINAHPLVRGGDVLYVAKGGAILRVTASSGAITRIGTGG